ncbi:Calx-beta domain-containing protein [Zavarzinella formosa]|uniref:Calx-beta domain-containing protein n=1 Tax=Zavarzinella formosa TaxID=360055 RepID=UPI000309A7D6|nr:Calx-beta domain-containing protein [Zavarzinella formosa]
MKNPLRFLFFRPVAPKVRRIRLRVQNLEEKIAPATVTWDGGDGTLDWKDAANWSGDAKPTAADDVVIPQTGITITHSTGTDVVKSVTTSAAINLAGGSLEVDGNYQMNGASSTLAGGQLKNATIMATGGATFLLSNAGGILSGGVAVAAGTTVDGTQNWNSYPYGQSTVQIYGGLTLNGTMNLGSASGDSWGEADFRGTQTLGGTGSLTFGSNTYNGIYARDNGTTLTIGAGMTVQGKTGTISDYGSYNSTENVVNQGNISVASGGKLVLGGDSWSNAGTINAAGATVTLGGTFTTAAIGNFNATGATVSITGALDNTATTLTLKPSWGGDWILSNGTINGGTITNTGGSKLLLSNAGGILAGGITIAAGTTVDGTRNWNSYPYGQSTAQVYGGLTLNGMLNLGSASGDSWGEVDFRGGTQTLGGTGSVTFGSNAYNGIYARDNGTTLTIGPAMTVEGGTGTLAAWGTYAAVEAVVSQGKISILNNGRVTVQSLTVADSAPLAVPPTGTLGVTGDLLATAQTANAFQLKGTVNFKGTGSAGSPQKLEAMSQDRGGAPANFAGDFTLGAVILNSGTYVKLVDNSDNSAGGGPEAVYADTIVVPANSTLNLNGLNVYARIAQVAGTVVNGSITIVPDGGGLASGTPASGKISAAGQTDDWTVQVQAGQTFLVQLNSGDGVNIPPVSPVLSRGGFDILDPLGAVIDTENATTPGQFLSVQLNNLSIPGTYTIRVHASTAQPNATGNYQVTARVAFIDTAPLTLGQRQTGVIENDASLDRWTFSANAGEQVLFSLLGATAPVKFALKGPNGWVGFDKLTSDSAPVTLPTTGQYVLEADGPTGSYAFRLAQTTLVDLTAGTPLQGTLAGGGQVQLFRVTATSGQSLLVKLHDNTPGDNNKLYVSYGAPPTLADYQFRSTDATGADQQVLVPQAYAGVYYILLYSQAVPAPSSFTLTASSQEVILGDISPMRSGTGADTTMVLTGTGFNTGSLVSLIASDGTAYPAAASLDSPTRLTATLAAGTIPAGSYRVRVTQAGGAASEVPGFTLVQGGKAKLVTDIKVPNPVGYHAASTIYVTYSNTGDAAMPAPLLVVSATQNGKQGALLTLDATRIASGFWTSATPDGYAQSVQFLAGGASPGVLLPGESVTVPVYYAGWLTDQWDFSRPPIYFTVGTLDTTNTETVDWSALKAGLRPDSVTPAAWDALYPGLTAHLGSTWGSYVARLDADARYLGSLGEKVTDLGRLVSFEIQQADGLSPMSSLASSDDAGVASPGLSLGLGRNFAPGIIARNRFGRFGYGWSDSWDTSLTVDADGSVNVAGPGGSQRRFQPDSRGGYFAQTGDHGTLAKLVGGGYTLTELDGGITAYNANGTLAYVQDTNGNRITAAFTGGLLTKLTHSSGQSLTLAYNASGLVSSITDSQGRVTTYAYDAAIKRLISVTGFDGRTTTYAYDAGANPATLNALTSVAYPDGSHGFFTYGADGRLGGTHRDGGAEATSFAYALGESSVTDALNHVSKFDFDDRGLLAKVTDPLGQATHYDYDASLNLVGTTDAAGQVWKNQYDSLGNVVSATDAAGHTVKFAYATAKNRLAAVTDANGHITGYGYDGQGNLTSTTYADGTVEQLAYDPVGNVLDATRRGGQVTHSTYDAAGNPLTRTFSDGSQTTYAYDARGNLITATDTGGATTLTYDANDRLTRITYPSGRYLQFTYDTAGRRTQMKDQDGFIVNYAYDTLGRLSELTDGANARIAAYTYDLAGRLSRQDNGNGTYTTNDYDAAGQLLHLIHYAPDGSINSRFDYTYDSLGNRITEATTDGTWTYTYDATSQLTHAVFASTNPAVPNQDLQYAYDPAGNRVSTVINGVTTAYTTNNLNEYTQVGDTHNTYDANGNLITATGANGTTTYTYDARNQLIGVTGPDGAYASQYDVFGHLAGTTANGTATQYLVDPSGMGNVVAAYNTGSLLAHYTYGVGLTSLVNAANAASYYDFDGVGSTAGLSGAAGHYVNSYAYQPFGEELYATSGVSNPFQYVGQFGVMNTGNGLDYMRSRNYSSVTGQFVTSDPLRLSGGDFNLYRYASNNATNFIDPMGTNLIGAALAVVLTLQVFTGVGQSIAPGSSPDIPSPGIQTLSSAPTDGGLMSLEEHEGIMAGKDALKELIEEEGTGEAIAKFGSGITGEGVLTTGLFGLAAGIAYGDYYLYTHPDALDNFWSPQVLDWTNNVLDWLDGLKLPTILSDDSSTSSVTSQDPNDLIGPAGYGSQHYVTANSDLPYRIDFENDASATAPAQQVVVTNQLSANLDWSTFQFTGFGFGDISRAAPANTQNYQTVVPLKYNGVTFEADVSVSFDFTTGQLRVVFQSVDPNTSLPPDVLTGFLPPEDGTGRGQGYLTYTIRAKSGLTTGTLVTNVAQISFDNQTIIATDQKDPHDPSQGYDPAKRAPVTIDADAPTAAVNPLPVYSATKTVPVTWGGADLGAGLDTFDVYVSTDGAAFVPWLTNTTSTSATYTGVLGHVYGFAAVASDFVGNTQTIPVTAQASVRVGVTPTALDDVFAVPPGKPLSGSVITNDAKGTLKLTATPVTFPTQGTLTLNANGTFKYVPNVNSTGRDFFTYKLVAAGGVESNVARVDLATHLANFRLAKASVSERTATATLTIDLNTPASAAVTVAYAVAPQTATPYGVDFTLADGVVNFAKGEKTKTITIPVVNDLLDENNETLQVRLTTTTGPVVTGKNGTATLTIVDDDATPKVSFRQKTSSAGEDVSPSLEVFLSAPSGRTVTVAYAAKGGTAKAGLDYTLAAGTLTFLPGETSKTIPLAVINDTLDEPDETVFVTLSKPVNAIVSGIPTHTHTILSDDPRRTVAFETSASTVEEAAKTVTLTVVLSSAAAFPVTVKYAIDPAGATATSGKDFTLAPGTLTFKAGETRKTITLRITDDKIHEPTETAAIRLSAPLNAGLGTADVYTLSITDND